MKLILGLVVGLMGLQQVALADHASLVRLSREMAVAATNLYQGARPVLGPRPTYRQRYAYEHISFFHSTAHGFERIVGSPVDDHASDIRYAFQQLERDLYNARYTFRDLFYGRGSCDSADTEVSTQALCDSTVVDDHPALGQLEGYLRYAENLSQQIRYNLP